MKATVSHMMGAPQASAEEKKLMEDFLTKLDSVDPNADEKLTPAAEEKHNTSVAPRKAFVARWGGCS